MSSPSAKQPTRCHTIPKGASWRSVAKIRRGHSYWAASEEFGKPMGRIAVADQSGAYPHTTDDGILWLDESRPITIGDSGLIGIPLRWPDGTDTVTPGSTAELEWLVEFRGMKVKIGSMILIDANEQ